MDEKENKSLYIKVHRAFLVQEEFLQEENISIVLEYHRVNVIHDPRLTNVHSVGDVIILPTCQSETSFARLDPLKFKCEGIAVLVTFYILDKYK